MVRAMYTIGFDELRALSNSFSNFDYSRVHEYLDYDEVSNDVYIPFTFRDWKDTVLVFDGNDYEYAEQRNILAHFLDGIIPKKNTTVLIEISY